MSDRPLAERLQVKGARRVAVVAPPVMRAVMSLGERHAPPEEAEVVLAFFPDRAALEARLPDLLARVRADVILWLAYPKLSSPLASDLSRDILHGLVPSYRLATVAAAAIDDNWTALRMKRV